MPTTQRKPRSDSRKSNRRPIAGRHDPLEIVGGDPKFYYKWVDDEDHTGTNIQRYKDAGYTFADKSRDNIRVGAASVHIHEDVGSHIRVSAGRTGGYLYLMKLPLEDRQDDLAAKAAIVQGTTESMHQDNKALEGSYGEVKIS